MTLHMKTRKISSSLLIETYTNPSVTSTGNIEIRYEGYLLSGNRSFFFGLPRKTSLVPFLYKKTALYVFIDE